MRDPVRLKEKEGAVASETLIAVDMLRFNVPRSASHDMRRHLQGRYGHL